MFNNAGIGSPLKRFLPDDLEDFSRIMHVNLFGVLVGAPCAAQYMKDPRGWVRRQQRVHRSDQQGDRHDLLPSFEGGHGPHEQVHGHRLAPYAIRVNCFTPAHIRTGITTYEMGPVLRYMQPLEREAQPEDVANAVCSSPATEQPKSPGSCSRSTGVPRPGPPTRRRS